MKGMKTGGRVKGSRNKVTAKGRDYLTNFLERYFGDGVEVPGVEGGAFVSFESDITHPSVNFKDRMVIIKDIMQYVYPKIQATQLDATVDSVDPLTLRLLEISSPDDENQ